MKTWLAQRTPTEKRMLLITALIGGVLLIWALFWRPLLQSNQQLAERLVSRQAQLNEIEQAATLAQQLKRQAAASPTSMRGDQSLLALADQSARARGLGFALKRAEPAGNDEVRLRFEGAQFNSLVQWLEALRFRRGIDVVELNIDSVGRPGLVDARITLKDTAQSDA